MPLGKKPRVLDEAGLLDYALKALGSRAQSTGDLRQKLRRRAERAQDVDTVIASLKEHGYLNDKKYAENYTAQRLENEGFGRARVLSDLRSKRVAPAVAQIAVDTAFAAIDEIALIEKFLERKYRRQPLKEVLADSKGVASAYRKLRVAGFSGSNALRVLKRFARDTETLEALESEE